MRSPIIKITQDSPDQQPVSSLMSATMGPSHESLAEKVSKFSSTGATKQSNLSSSSQDSSSASGLGRTKLADSSTTVEQTHAYGRRFFILALFCLHSAINSFQWIQYSSITPVVARYYSVSNIQVNLTSLVYMITYIPFIIHASLMLERVGLRKAVVLGTCGTALGSLIKWLLGAQPGIISFWLMMFGQTIVALSQLYIISIPPLLAAVWFPDDQVSTATGLGVFGNQLGIALGFIIPPMLISDERAPIDVLGADLERLARITCLISVAICLVSLVSFQEKPPKPPGSARLHAANQLEQSEPAPDAKALSSIRELFKDADFNYLFLSYGINVGCFYAVSTVLSQMVDLHWKSLIDLAGKMGLLIVVSGMLGSVICGQLLDRTHAYKLVIVVIYFMSLSSMVLFTFVVHFSDLVWPLYLASLILGFFMTGYLPLGFEFAAEITYPHPANTPAGLLNLSAQVFGLILTYATSLMVDQFGDLWANGFLTIFLAIGVVLTLVMRADLKRQKAVRDEQVALSGLSSGTFCVD